MHLAVSKHSFLLTNTLPEGIRLMILLTDPGSVLERRTHPPRPDLSPVNLIRGEVRSPAGYDSIIDTNGNPRILS